MTYLFISDLHLSENYPRFIRGFLDLLVDYTDRNTQLYILGDWFNAWLGDDNDEAWLKPIVIALQEFQARGNQVYFQTGNRDFMLGHDFLRQFNGILLPEVAYITLGNTRFRLEHGDALCTDDVSYQRFKKIIRHPIILKLLSKTPLNFRKTLANTLRQKSQNAQQDKVNEIMDVNQEAVLKALHDCDVLIHGHTHRPMVHQIGAKLRIVLGDWRESSQSAEILEINEQGEWLSHHFMF